MTTPEEKRVLDAAAAWVKAAARYPDVAPMHRLELNEVWNAAVALVESEPARALAAKQAIEGMRDALQAVRNGEIKPKRLLHEGTRSYEADDDRKGRR